MAQRTCIRSGCENPHRALGLCSKHWKQEYGKRTKYTITCIVCHREHQSDRRDGKFCSDTCKAAEYASRGFGPHCKIPAFHAAHQRWRGRLLPAVRMPEHPVLASLANTLICRRWYSGQCQRCSTWFVSDQPANRYCSARCAKGDARDRRRARQRQAFIARVYRRRIFERDRWHCRLCGKKVKRDAVVPHPLAPVLDHIIPLAKGGTHEPANVQCAHFLCNSRKSDGGHGEQLMLLG